MRRTAFFSSGTAFLLLSVGLGFIAADPGNQSEAADASEVVAEDGTTTSSPTSTEPAPTTAPPPPTTEAPTTTVPPTTEAPTTTAPPPPAPPPPPDPTLQQGSSGEAVVTLQNRLVELGYWLGEGNGDYGQTTQQAVMAFQKAEGLSRDGIAGPETLAQLDAAGSPRAASTSGNLIEIDLTRQLLFVIENGRVLWVFNTSSGASGTPTPPGNFVIEREIDGYRKAELGTLYRPKYFNGGIAIHGFPSIPGYPASHGCTRVSNAAMDWLWTSGHAPKGTAVWVH